MTIEDEWTRHLMVDYPEKEGAIREAVQQMQIAIPDCLINGYEPIIASIQLPDPNERRVIAAALVGHADVIVTSNIKDFPVETLDSYGVEVHGPDELIANQLGLYPVRALHAFKRMRERWQRPELSAAEMVELMQKRGLAMTAAHLRDPAIFNLL